MASRRAVAAAVCMLASGLIVGGSCASLAFAEPGTGGSDGGAGDHGNDTGGTGGGQQSGAPAAGPIDIPRIIGNLPGSNIGSNIGSRVKSVIGDGRNGRTGTVGGSTEPSRSSSESTNASKPSETGAAGPPAAKVPTPGEQSPSNVEAGGPSASAAPTPAKESTPDTKTVAPPATETSTRATLAPTSIPSALLDALGVDGEAGTDPDVPWWPVPKFPLLLLGNDHQNLAAPPAALPQIPTMQLPVVVLPAELPVGLLTQLPRLVLDPVVDVVRGLATAASQLPFAMIALPVVVPGVGAPGGVAGGNGTAGIGPGPLTPPRASINGEPPVTGKIGEPQGTPKSVDPPVFSAGSGLMASPSYRAGYGDYLRAAGLGEVAAVAVPGVSGILLLTGAGGLLGYRQARAGRIVRASGPGRFMG